MIREGYRDIMTLFGWPVGWAVILMLPILLPLVWWDEHVTQPRYARKRHGDDPAQGMSAFGQDAEERLEAKPASPVANGDAPQ